MALLRGSLKFLKDFASIVSVALLILAKGGVHISGHGKEFANFYDSGEGGSPKWSLGDAGAVSAFSF